MSSIDDSAGYASIAALGWQPFFQQQLSLDEWNDAIPARVVEQQKSQITVATESGVFDVPLTASNYWVAAYATTW